MVVSFGLIVKEGDCLISFQPGDAVVLRMDLVPDRLKVLRDKYGHGAKLIVVENGHYGTVIVRKDGQIGTGSLVHVRHDLLRYWSEEVLDPISDDDLCRLLSYTVR